MLKVDISVYLYVYGNRFVKVLVLLLYPSDAAVLYISYSYYVT